MNNLLGVVLCGGESKRMGSDKGLLLRGDSTWAQYMADKLVSFQVPVVYSINQGQWAAYSSFIPAGQLLIDSLDIPGPLNGLLSVHAKFPEKDLILLACDMIDLDESTIRKMIDTYIGETADFFVYEDSGFAQPFCGIYTAPALSRAMTVSGRQDLRDFSFQSLLGRGITRRLTIDQPGAFTNYNSNYINS